VESIQEKRLEFRPEFFLHVSLYKYRLESTHIIFQVMDFSASQRAAHAEEYADAKILLNPGFSSLTKASQLIERQAYLEEAQSAELGCSFHFWQSATRLKANGTLIPRDSTDTFDHILHTLVSPATSSEDFSKNVQVLRTDFPRINGWLNWWLRPNFASMIFPACSKVNLAVSTQVPSTSNPAEHSHSLLHHAVGTDHDLIPGIKRLFLHVQEIEAQYNAIKGMFRI
jgi:hypothetical protein